MSPKEIESLVRSGKPYREIREWIEEKTGQKVSESYVTVVAQRHGFAKKSQNLYRDTVPWVVRREHAQTREARCLRWLGRRRAGLELNSDQRQRLESFLRRLEDTKALVTYFAEDMPEYGIEAGWHFVDAEEYAMYQPDPEIPIAVLPGQELRKRS